MSTTEERRHGERRQAERRQNEDRRNEPRDTLKRREEERRKSERAPLIVSAGKPTSGQTPAFFLLSGANRAKVTETTTTPASLCPDQRQHQPGY